MKPPRTPPYLLLLFYGVNAISGLADLIAVILGWTKDLGTIALDILRATVPIGILWIAGTFPLEEVLPCSNVASDKDVSEHPCK